MKALDYLLHGGKTDVFNLGNGKGFSVLDVINAAQRITGQDIDYSVQARRPGDPAVLVASGSVFSAWTMKLDTTRPSLGCMRGP